MKSEKAYKLLALQENISNRAAKELIDKGLVYVGNEKVKIARGVLKVSTKFKIKKIENIKTIFQDDKIVAVDKPAFLNSEEVSKIVGYPLLNRLDRETSGVLLLYKDENFRETAIEEFKKQRVLKEYFAWVEGIVSERIVIDTPILTFKKRKAYSKVSSEGKEALSIVEPLMIEGKKTKVKVVIKTGRTHQARVHLKSIGYPIIGDIQYGGRKNHRLLLHSHKVELLSYSFVSEEPSDFHY